MGLSSFFAFSDVKMRFWDFVMVNMPRSQNNKNNATEFSIAVFCPFKSFFYTLIIWGTLNNPLHNFCMSIVHIRQIIIL